MKTNLSNVELGGYPDSYIVCPMEGPSPHIPLQLVIKAIKLMKCGKAAGTYLIIANILKASGVKDTLQIRYLIEDIIHFGKIPSEWDQSIIVFLYNGMALPLSVESVNVQLMNARAIICWMCGATIKPQVRSQDISERVQLDDLAKVLHNGPRRWHGLVERNDGWLKEVL